MGSACLLRQVLFRVRFYFGEKDIILRYTVKVEFFKTYILDPNTRVTEEVIITQEELVDCLVCFDRMCAMFIYPTANCATKIRSKCRMTSMSKDPTYNPFSKGMSMTTFDFYRLQRSVGR